MMKGKDGCTKPATFPDGKVPNKQTGSKETNPTFTPPESKMPRQLK